jgi:hypothetical protein
VARSTSLTMIEIWPMFWICKAGAAPILAFTSEPQIS